MAIHGGAGTILKSQLTHELKQEYTKALDDAISIGNEILSRGGSSLDAVEAAVNSMEDCHLFNAGRGSVYTADGTHEMDASIMDGATLEAGAVGLVHSVKNPISLARKVMEDSDHVFLAGEGAMKFANENGLTMEPEEYFHDQYRYDQWQSVKGTSKTQLDHSGDEKFGTVGAVALDSHGNLAAATSTGGMTNKNYGRLGDSPVIGAGTYASNKTCAVSCTGSGEYFIRGVAAYEVSALMEFAKHKLSRAADIVVMERLMKINGDGGLIAVDNQGNIALPFNTEGMYRARIDVNGNKEIAIFR